MGICQHNPIKTLVDLCLHHKVTLEKMSVYELNSRQLREVLIFCFNMKNSAAEAHRILSNTYGEAAISERTCREWFQRFKNGDFDVQGHDLYLVGPTRRSVL